MKKINQFYIKYDIGQYMGEYIGFFSYDNFLIICLMSFSKKYYIYYVCDPKNGNSILYKFYNKLLNEVIMCIDDDKQKDFTDKK